MTALAKHLLRDHPDVLSESEFSGLVVDTARVGGWTLRYHTFQAKRSAFGFPDWVFLHPGRHRIDGELLPELLFVELKSETGKVRPEQAKWIDGLQRFEVLAAVECTEWVPVRARVWRPSDWPEIVLLLTGRTLA
jgi:hypothetical protein